MAAARAWASRSGGRCGARPVSAWARSYSLADRGGGGEGPGPAGPGAGAGLGRSAPGARSYSSLMSVAAARAWAKPVWGQLRGQCRQRLERADSSLMAVAVASAWPRGARWSGGQVRGQGGQRLGAALVADRGGGGEGLGPGGRAGRCGASSVSAWARYGLVADGGGDAQGPGRSWLWGQMRGQGGQRLEREADSSLMAVAAARAWARTLARWSGGRCGARAVSASGAGRSRR